MSGDGKKGRILRDWEGWGEGFSVGGEGGSLLVLFSLLLDIADLARDVLQRGFVVLVGGLQLYANQLVIQFFSIDSCRTLRTLLLVELCFRRHGLMAWCSEGAERAVDAPVGVAGSSVVSVATVLRRVGREKATNEREKFGQLDV